MYSVVQAYENITQKERHKCSLAFELYSYFWTHIKIVHKKGIQLMYSSSLTLKYEVANTSKKANKHTNRLA